MISITLAIVPLRALLRDHLRPQTHVGLPLLEDHQHQSDLIHLVEAVVYCQQVDRVRTGEGKSKF